MGVPAPAYWGFFLPQALCHVQCVRCPATYDARTGRSNDPLIVVLHAVYALALLGALLLGGALMSGCSHGNRPVTPRPLARPPGQVEVEEAASELSDRIRRLYPGGGWPPHLPRSQDFPTLPLVAVEPFEDEKRSGADLTALQAQLEEALRREHLVRLEADEMAVPPSLREAAAVSAPAGLVLRAWVDPARRVRLALEDRTGAEPVVLVVGRSHGM